MTQMRDGNTAKIGYFRATRERGPIKLHELRSIRSIVHPDGNDARLTLYTGDGTIPMIATLSDISAVDAEIRSTAELMQFRQAMKKDAGAAAFQELFLTALRPGDIAVIADKVSGDRLIVMQFTDRLPIVVRLSPEALEITLRRIGVTAKRIAN
jgi:hypothetical protein